MSYWMIEKQINGQAHWWIPVRLLPVNIKSTNWDDPCRWTTDASKAVHYNSKEEAEYVMGLDMPSCKATEHIDYPREEET